MKRCEYCGRENTDDSTLCSGCGNALAVDTGVVEPPLPTEKIALLESEIEAERLRTELTHRNMAHCIISYHDSAFDGLFQLYRGWGYVEAAPQYKDTIVSILQAIREPNTEPESPSTEV